MSNSLGLYLHVPFCLSKCAYCDFYSLSDSALRGDYVKALCTSLFDAAKTLSSPMVDTVFFGGGTPSLLSGKEVERILFAVRAFSLSSSAEISMEVNPATVTRESLMAYRACGVNRISIGMQAATREELSLLSRRHTPEETGECVRLCREAGFENVSLDLMYGLPGQTEALWQNSLDTALSYHPEHLSLYALTLSENVPLFQRAGELPDDETARIFYHMACETLEKAGLPQYEISNFARDGFCCRHNLRYWKREDYLGFGPSAASCYASRRYSEPEDLSGFLFRPEGLIERIFREEPMDEREQKEEELILSLRLKAGLELSSFAESLSDPARFLSEIKRLEEGGLCRIKNGTLALTEEGFFVSNEILSRLMLLLEDE